MVEKRSGDCLSRLDETVMDLSEKAEKYIDSLSYEQLLHGWRYAKAGDQWLQGETGEYWGNRMAELRKNGADHVAASKAIGWEKP
jgi:hypothetical protein